jgi:hypothetical protein
MVTLVRHYIKALSTYGVNGTFIQLYNFGHVKFGTKIGEDRFGNQYFENGVDYPIGAWHTLRWTALTKLPTSIFRPEPLGAL